MDVKAILLGSTGMIGKGALLECLENSRVSSVLAINRKPIGIHHPKLREVIHSDFQNYSSLNEDLSVYNACFFCLGVSSAGMSEKEYHRITYDFTIEFAHHLLEANRDLTFCYVSGAGTDSTEKGSSMWARVKGKTENALLAMPFRATYMFRPGFIQPVKGVKSKTKLYRAIYAIFTPFYFVLKSFKGVFTDTESLGKAMISVALTGYEKKILSPKDINALSMSLDG